MSWTSLVQAEWPEEFKRDFNIITCELSCATLLFSLVILKPSGTFEFDPSNRYIRKSSNEILAVQDRFPNRFNRGPRRPDPCHTQPVRNSTDILYYFLFVNNYLKERKKIILSMNAASVNLFIYKVNWKLLYSLKSFKCIALTKHFSVLFLLGYGFSSCVPLVLFFLLGWFLRCEVSGCTAVVS